MRWAIAGVLFALAVALAIGTAAIRADNVALRRAIEIDYRAVGDRIVQLERLRFLELAALSPERLAKMHRQWLLAEQQRRMERLQ